MDSTDRLEKVKTGWRRSRQAGGGQDRLEEVKTGCK
jgi:hypothetical protein